MDRFLSKDITSLIPGINRKTLLSLLRKMVMIRAVEEKIRELYPEQEMRCPAHLYIGQEAVSSGVGECLKDKDYVFSSYRSHGAYLTKGGSIKKLFAELYGKRTGCSGGRGGSMHIISKDTNFMGSSALVGGIIPLGAGIALSSLMKRQRTVSVVFFGEGAVEEGVFHETLNFAALKKLPLIFVCENNLYATHTHQSERQARDNIYLRSGIYGIPGLRVDGNNVLEVFKASKAAIDNARKGKGPALIECRTYRWLEHVGPYPDYGLGYRTKDELDAWMRRCPLSNYKYALLNKRIITADYFNKIETGFREEIERAVIFAKNSPFPDDKEIHADVYDKKKKTS